jgi:predicted metal-dependent hydrolase
VDEIRYEIRRSARARRVRVTVDNAGAVEVVLPRRAGEREAAAAVRELRPWIERRVAEVAQTRAVVAARGDTVPYLGRTLHLVPQPGRVRAHRRADQLIVPAGDARDRAIEAFYRRAAYAEIEPRLDLACAETGTTYARLTIRGQRTRWASCSRTGTMSFNWRLLLAPEPVLDYVVWHEVCHLEVMDHSERFWGLLAQRWPQYREHARWLRRHGSTLVL